jgi:uncharacterized protein YuzE
VSAITYKIKYEEEADVLTIILEVKGKLSRAKEEGDFIVHVDRNDAPLFLEILNASKIVPLMIEGLVKKEATVA